MTLADSSAWLEFIRGTGSRVHARVREAIRDRMIVTTDVVVMEVLAGARDREHVRRLRNLLAGAHFTPVGGPSAWERAAAIYRACRAAGVTPRSQLDCLIAAVAIREGVPVLHADRDFDRIAQHTTLQVVSYD